MLEPSLRRHDSSDALADSCITQCKQPGTMMYMAVSAARSQRLMNQLVLAGLPDPKGRGALAGFERTVVPSHFYGLLRACHTALALSTRLAVDASAEQPNAEYHDASWPSSSRTVHLAACEVDARARNTGKPVFLDADGLFPDEAVKLFGDWLRDRQTVEQSPPACAVFDSGSPHTPDAGGSRPPPSASRPKHTIMASSKAAWEINYVVPPASSAYESSPTFTKFERTTALAFA
ncbi:hypothetical protein SVAN01_06986 [Stagonosporopsis vannaccii]|nr:hypothetical protein SVAN01_06986 [Stagonosporopsis vannaccii]